MQSSYLRSRHEKKSSELNQILKTSFGSEKEGTTQSLERKRLQSDEIFEKMASNAALDTSSNELVKDIQLQILDSKKREQDFNNKYKQIIQLTRSSNSFL